MKVIMMIGEPAVGKSTIMRRFMGQFEGWQTRAPKYVPYHYLPTHNIAVLGKYDDPDQKYPGTDRMSMAAQPRVLEWMDAVRGKGDLAGVLFEGDRLGNQSMIDGLRQIAIEPTVLWIYVDDVGLAARRVTGRGDQNQRFWTSRRTKVKNIALRNSEIPMLRNRDELDLGLNVALLNKLLNVTPS